METLIKQDSCYYLSPEYASSFKGKFIWLYEGKVQLKLTSKSLILETTLLFLEIPFSNIISIDWGAFSRWSKPFGLAYLIVKHHQNEKEKTIFLVPHKSGFMPTWQTNQVIENWLQAFKQIDEIKTRVKRQELSIPKTAPVAQLIIFFMVVVIPPILFLIWLLR
jgi:hypothetical protein